MISMDHHIKVMKTPEAEKVERPASKKRLHIEATGDCGELLWI